MQQVSRISGARPRCARDDAVDHVGVHRGVVLYREGDYFGRAVNLAARLLGLAGRDELIASEAVVRATAGHFDWESRGTQDIRGFSEPIRVYRLRSAPPS